MKRFLLVATLIASSAVLAGQTSYAPRTKEAVIAADERWGQAEQDGNSQYVDHLLLDGYTSIGSAGKVTTKAQIVKGAKERGKSAEYSKMVADWKAKHPSVANVAIYGDTAVLTWLPTNAGSTPPVNSSDIFVFRDGDWRAIYSQHTTAPDKSL